MRSPARFLHLVASEPAAENVAELLERLGRDEDVISVGAAYDLGPLQDVDRGAAGRVAFWNRLAVAPLDDAEVKALDDAEVWDRIRSSAADIVLWHGPHAAEYLCALRACWHLRHQPACLHEVVLPPLVSAYLPAFYGAVATARPEEVASHWERRAEIHDVEARAARWEELRDEPGEWVRILEGHEIQKLPLTAFDDRLLDACDGGEWTRSLLVAGSILADHPVDDRLLFWRMRELLRDGSFEGRGPIVETIQLPEEVRPAARDHYEHGP